MRVLFLLQQYFLPELVDLGRLPDTGIDGVRCPTAAVRDGVLGQCDDVEHCRLDVAGPVLGQRDGRWGGLTGHGGLEAKALVLISSRKESTEGRSCGTWWPRWRTLAGNSSRIPQVQAVKKITADQVGPKNRWTNTGTVSFVFELCGPWCAHLVYFGSREERSRRPSAAFRAFTSAAISC